MTDEEIKNYFIDKTIFKFDGKFDELELLLHSNLISFNTLTTNYVLYFVCADNNDNDKVKNLNQERITVFFESTGV